MKYRKKPVTIEAWQLKHNNVDMPIWLEQAIRRQDARFVNYKTKRTAMIIKTLEGDHTANIGDFIIQGVAGEIYPCKPDIFKATYEKVE